MDNSTLCAGDSFASDLLEGVKMFVVHSLAMGASWEPEGGHSRVSTGAALLGVVALLLLCPEELENLWTRGANPPSLPPSAVCPVTGGGGRPPRTALPAKAVIDLGPCPKRLKAVLAFCKLYSMASKWHSLEL